jgi:hypothetical protein
MKFLLKALLVSSLFSFSLAALADDSLPYASAPGYAQEDPAFLENTGFFSRKKEACRGNEAGDAAQCTKYNMKMETSGRCYGDDPEDKGIPAPCCCFG